MQGTYHIKQFLSFVLKERFHPRAYARGPQLKFDRKTFKNIVDVRFRIAMPNDNELPRSRAARYQNEFLSY